MRPIVADARKVAVLGAGSWGTTFAKILADGGSRVAVWARRPELAREIMQSRRNSDYLPGINLPRGISRARAAARGARGRRRRCTSRVPSQSLRENLRIVRDVIPPDAIIVSLMKGVEMSTRLRMSEVIEQELGVGPERIAVVSGPEPRARDREGAAHRGGRLVDGAGHGIRGRARPPPTRTSARS